MRLSQEYVSGPPCSCCIVSFVCTCMCKHVCVRWWGEVITAVNHYSWPHAPLPHQPYALLLFMYTQFEQMRECMEKNPAFFAPLLDPMTEQLKNGGSKGGVEGGDNQLEGGEEAEGQEQPAASKASS